MKRTTEPGGVRLYGLIVDAGKRERNAMKVRVTGGVTRIRDRNAPMKARGRYCERLGRHLVRCKAPKTDDVRITLDKRDDKLRVSVRGRRATANPDVRGGRGRDRIVIRDASADMEGDRGDDVLLAGRGANDLFGGGGDDHIRGGRGDDHIEGGPGRDVLHGERGEDHLYGGDQSVRSKSAAGRDRLHGGMHDDTLDDGDDDGRGAIGRDKLVGGYGTDFVGSYREREKPVAVDLRRRGRQGQQGENDRLHRVEDVYGGDADDRLIGNGDENVLRGRGGDDFVRGKGGDDRIEALDEDRVTGDHGDDEIITAASSNARPVRCGVGDDLVVSDSHTTPSPHEHVAAGPHLASNCDLVQGRNRLDGGGRTSFTAVPTPAPMTDSGDLTFTLVEFDCCEHNFRLTRAQPPFEELDSTKADASQVTVTAPPDVVAQPEDGPVTLRIATFDAHGTFAVDPQPLVWRVNVSR